MTNLSKEAIIWLSVVSAIVLVSVVVVAVVLMRACTRRRQRRSGLRSETGILMQSRNDSGKPGKRMRSHDLRSSMTGRSVGFQPGGQTVAQAAVRREQMVHPGIPVIPENSYLQPPKLERRSRYYQSKAWSHRLSRPLSQIGRAV